MSKELLLDVLTELQEPMCQAVDQHCGRYTRDIESHAVSIVMSSQDEMQMKVINLEQGDKWFVEYGCTICDLGPQGYKLTDCIKGTTGSGVRIDIEDCYDKERGRRVGTFHTHPYGGASPSVGDIMSAFIEPESSAINFVGGVVGGRKVIMGYAARPDSMMKWEMREKVERYGFTRAGATEYVVQFFFRMPEATSSHKPSIKRYNVFSEDKEMHNFMNDIDYLKSIFDVMVRWC